MNKFLITMLTAAGLTAVTIGGGGIAAAAPTGPSQVDQTVRSLEARGYNVIINRTGSAPLTSCTVTSVRPGQTHTTFDSRGSSSPSETVTAKSVHVDVEC
jgi:hypothetical protein